MECTMIKKSELVEDKNEQLIRRYPVESTGSAYAVWTRALKDGFVSEELYEEARKYYGDLWHYIPTGLF